MSLYKNKKSSYLKYWEVNHLYGWATPQKFPVDDFKWIEDTSEFDEDFIKSYSKESDEEYFIEVDTQYLEDLPLKMYLLNLHNFYLKQ